MARHAQPVEERFWAKVDKRAPAECWPWTGTTSRGYGHMSIAGTIQRAHRISYVLAHGPIPVGGGYHGTVVCHRCDNRRCVNPGHLFLGTQADNIADAVSKHRQPRAAGTRNGHNRLSPQDVLRIRAVCAEATPYTEVARAFGVGPSVVRLIALGKLWKGVAA